MRCRLVFPCKEYVEERLGVWHSCWDMLRCDGSCVVGAGFAHIWLLNVVVTAVGSPVSVCSHVSDESQQSTDSLHGSPREEFAGCSTSFHSVLGSRPFTESNFCSCGRFDITVTKRCLWREVNEGMR
jgi:hypothetical protein